MHLRWCRRDRWRQDVSARPPNVQLVLSSCCAADCGSQSFTLMHLVRAKMRLYSLGPARRPRNSSEPPVVTSRSARRSAATIHAAQLFRRDPGRSAIERRLSVARSRLRNNRPCASSLAARRRTRLLGLPSPPPAQRLFVTHVGRSALNLVGLSRCDGTMLPGPGKR